MISVERSERNFVHSERRTRSWVTPAGATGLDGTVPAIVVFRPSIGKRVMVRMPDSPATSLLQFSALPAPSEVTMPIPVTTTMGRPNLSRTLILSPVAYPSAAPRSLD